jgi:hypothetical protein
MDRIAAIRRKGMAGHEIRFLACQEQRQPARIPIRLAQAAGRRTELSRNGMRNPQAASLAFPNVRSSSRNSPFESRNAAGGPSCRNMPNHAPRPRGTFSTARSAAPSHLPPRPMPPAPGETGTAMPGPGCRCGHSPAAVRSPPSKCPWSAAMRPGWICARRGRRNARPAAPRKGGRRRRFQKWQDRNIAFDVNRSFASRFRRFFRFFHARDE